MIRVLIPTPLYSYTGGKKHVEAEGGTVDELLRDIDRQYPGLRFRIVDEQDQIRTHIRVFVNSETANPVTKVTEGDDVAIAAALSGG